jgi:copper oxidase (laccase) domain-containing protein
MKILSGTSNLKLSKNIAKNLKLKLINTNIRRFADGEIYIEINENIRGNSVFVIQSTSNPANDNLMELLLVIDALRRFVSDKLTELKVKIYHVNYDTFKEKHNFFSYRRSYKLKQKDYGRCISVISLI